jgi:hypothetical protein
MKVYCLLKDFGPEGEELLGVFAKAKDAENEADKLNKAYKYVEFIVEAWDVK